MPVAAKIGSNGTRHSPPGGLVDGQRRPRALRLAKAVDWYIVDAGRFELVGSGDVSMRDVKAVRADLKECGSSQAVFVCVARPREIEEVIGKKSLLNALRSLPPSREEPVWHLFLSKVWRGSMASTCSRRVRPCPSRGPILQSNSSSCVRAPSSRPSERQSDPRVPIGRSYGRDDVAAPWFSRQSPARSRSRRSMMSGFSVVRRLAR